MSTLDTDIVSAIARVLTRANGRFDRAIAALQPPPPPRELTQDEKWNLLAQTSRNLQLALAEAFRRAAIALPILAFGTPEQRRAVEDLMRGNRR